MSTVEAMLQPHAKLKEKLNKRIIKSIMPHVWRSQSLNLFKLGSLVHHDEPSISCNSPVSRASFWGAGGGAPK